MVPFEIPQTLKAAARILILGAAALPHTGSPQPTFKPLAKDARQRQIVEKIQQEQSQNGPFSADLIAPLTALGLLYQEDGSRTLAAAAIEQARQAVRVNYGLRSLQEAPLLRQAIDNEEARGDFDTAWDLEQDLLAIARRHPDDLRTAQIFRDIADKRVDILRRYRAGEYPPEIVLGCYYNGGRDPKAEPWGIAGSCHAGSRDVVIGSIRREAHFYYARAIDIILRNEGYSSEDLPEFLTEVIRTSYEEGDFGLGEKCLRHLYSLKVVNSEPLLAQMNALVQAADWDVLYANRFNYYTGYESVLEAYEEAYRRLEKRHMAQASLDEIFSPKIPAVLPTFLPNPLVSEQTAESTGYIDVAFDITKYGKSDHVEILDTTKNATRIAERDLVRLIKRGSFRPQVVNGRIADSAPIVLRYYVND